VLFWEIVAKLFWVF